MAYQPEAELERNLLKQLVNQGYKAVKIADYDALLSNFKQQLNLFNEHIELAIDMTVDEQEAAPIIDKVEANNDMLSTTCSFCENEAIYSVNP